MQRYTQWKERWSKYNQEYCSVCETTEAGGTLLCCDGCPLAYHLKVRPTHRDTNPGRGVGVGGGQRGRERGVREP